MNIQIRQPVTDALRTGRGVVGLESVVFAHGLPVQYGPEVAFEVEEQVRAAGAVPATCAIIEGTAVVGLTREEIADMSHNPPPKANSASMITSMGLGKSAALTAGATARLCHSTGIRVVATGGIGGVHRGDEDDVSSDLHVLATCPLIMVCSGPKIILDLRRTFELLETLEIIVTGYRCAAAPGFYVRDTDIPLTETVESVDDIEKIWRTARFLDFPTSVLVLNPPPEEYAFRITEINSLIGNIESETAGTVSGKAVTPRILSRLQDELGPRSITLNKSLLCSNAKLAAEISISLAT